MVKDHISVKVTVGLTISPAATAIDFSLLIWKVQIHMCTRFGRYLWKGIQVELLYLRNQCCYVVGWAAMKNAQ